MNLNKNAFHLADFTEQWLGRNLNGCEPWVNLANSRCAKREEGGGRREGRLRMSEYEYSMEPTYLTYLRIVLYFIFSNIGSAARLLSSS